MVVGAVGFRHSDGHGTALLIFAACTQSFPGYGMHAYTQSRYSLRALQISLAGLSRLLVLSAVTVMSEYPFRASALSPFSLAACTCSIIRRIHSLFERRVKKKTQAHRFAVVVLSPTDHY